MGYRRFIEWNGVEEVKMGAEALFSVFGLALTVASTAASVYSSYTSSTQKKGGGVVSTPKRDDPKIREAAEMEARSLKAKRGMASTILTGPEGITTSPTTLKTELGS